MPRSLRSHALVLFGLGCLVPFVCAASLMIWYWPGAIPLDHVSGVWTALAYDFSQGVLYRPVAGAFGYGGTRYMPLFFVLHGFLIRAGIDVVTAGLVMTIVSICMLSLGVYLVLRALGVRNAIAAPASVLLHASIAFQLLTLQVKGDLLAASLNLYAVYFGLKYLRSSSRLAWVGILVSTLGASLTKFTAVGGLLFVLGLFGQQRRFKPAGTLLVAFAILAIGSVAWIQAASEGRFMASFVAVGSGGMDLGYALKFPVWFVQVSLKDPFFLILLLASLPPMVLWAKRRMGSKPLAYLLLTAGLTLPLFTSPGTDHNHLIDLLVASVVLLAFQAGREAERIRYRAVPVVIGALTLIMFLPGVPSVQKEVEARGRPDRAITETVAGAPGQGPILSENPIIPVLMGNRPVLLDPFSLRILAKSYPQIGADFDRRVERRDFAAVILLDWSRPLPQEVWGALRRHTSRGAQRFYGEVHFPAGFLSLLADHYSLSMVQYPFLVFTPRSS